ncbi:DUF882 domain-containing protein [Methylocystis heyeri]|uniref:DUF882 domain-containing protein n=1 Tax=Methylocystis heyeri TaxID=391905 RepID=UPI001FE2C88B
MNLFYVHTQESISATYLVNGQYDRNVLQQLNWFLRDWRRDEPTNMDPRLFDVVWEAYRSAGAGGEVVKVVSAYRSPQTNAMLRARSRAVAKYSQHMLGKAMDTTLPGMPMSRIREVGMRMQRGGVGYYPTAGTPFVHLDVGNVRAWPRMTYEQLVELFPDGKTVHIPSNGQPLARYEEAKAEIEARNNGAVVMEPRRSPFGFLAFLFGGGEDEAEDVTTPAPAPRKQWAALAPRNSRSARAAAESDEEGGGEAPLETPRRGREVLAKAEANLPRGETVMTAAPDDGAAAAAKADAAAAKAAAAAAAKAEAAAAKAEAAEREKLERAPLPPQRPASLEKADPQEAMPSDKRLAAIEPEANSPNSAVSPGAASTAGAEPDAAASDIDAPLPPRRPHNLAAGSNAPLPPVRPTEFASAGKSDANASQEQPTPQPVALAPAPLPQPRPKNLRAGDKAREDGALSNLMDSTGSSAHAAKPRSPASDDDPLAFAPPTAAKGTSSGAKSPAGKTTIGKSTPGPRAEFVPARLEPSNFHAMTAASPTIGDSAAPASGSSMMGASVGGVRAAAHASRPGALKDIEPTARPAFSDDAGADGADAPAR